MSDSTCSSHRAWIWLPLIVAAFLAAVAPTLSWMEFSNGMENLNVATVLEMRRGGPWMVPTLEGEPRVAKPPLTAWVTAANVPAELIDRLNDRDAEARDGAYRSLAFRVRITALVACALTLLATFDLGRTIGGTSRAGVVGAAICASNYFFLRFCRNATTDVQLTLWVTIANAFLARAILIRATWLNTLGAGLALGLAMMSKGPVALVQSVLPAVAFVGWHAWARRGSNEVEPIRWRGARIAPAALVGVLISSWFIYAAAHNPAILRRWLSETNPGGGDRMTSNNYGLYFVILPFMLPWTAFLIDGLVRVPLAAWRERRNRSLSSATVRAMYPIITLVVTFVVMSCFKDRKERYLLPIVPVAAVIAARGFIAMRDREPHALPVPAHWITLAIMACIPLVGIGTFAVKTWDGRPWFEPRFALIATGSALAIVSLGALLFHRAHWNGAAVGAAVALMLLLQAVGIRGYRLSREGRSDMRPLAESIRRSFPDAEMNNWRADGQRKRAPVDLSIYLNRVTRWIADPATLPPSDRPQIYLTLQEKDEPDPQPAPGGWRFFDKVKRDKDWYVAFVRAAR